MFRCIALALIFHYLVKMVEVSVAPMMEYTNRHYRYLARLLSKRVKLYTEMVVDQTILNQLDNLEPFLGFHQAEKPLGKRHSALRTNLSHTQSTSIRGKLPGING